MSSEKELIMYSRSTPCPFVNTVRNALKKLNIPYRELLIDQDPMYERRVVTWTGFLSVPTLVIANVGETMPFEEPAYLERGTSPRGIDRGSMLTEPTESELTNWLQKHGLLTQVG
ncbi:MAG TPA: glutaredoxin family protein [Aggregatilineales bacterium]|nr:glutaredoxin family protein [Aggregatilineales bacterium]